MSFPKGICVSSLHAIKRIAVALALLPIAFSLPAQETPTQPPTQTEPAAPPKGKVIFQREEKQPPPDSDTPEPNTTVPAESSSLHSDTQTPNVPDADVTVAAEEREAITFTAYDLDLHLTPATAGIEAHANLTVRNDGKAPLTRLALQLSSSLVWESLRLRTGPSTPGGASSFVQHRIDTDADHTGVAREAVLTLPQPLAPGASAYLTAIYSGSISQSGERLERIGAPADKAAEADWDTIATSGTALRGYGNVLWYPVSGAPVFLGEGAKLFDSVGRAKLRQQSATIRLRLTIAYSGDAPDAAYLCGRRELFAAVSDNDSLPIASAQGVATVEFVPHTLGFRVASLFVTDRAATTTDGALIRAVTDQSGVLSQYAVAAEKVQPLLMDWLGDNPLGPLDIIDLDLDGKDLDAKDPTGKYRQSFEDAALLVTPLQAAEPHALTPVLVHTLAHSWFASNRVWLDEGVAQFLSLLWVEANDGRQAGIDRLQSAARTLALAEPDFSATKTAAGQSLIDASSEVYYRTKAASVLWMLRSITSDEALKQAFKLYRKNHTADATAEGFEQVLEETSHKDLKWFFDDWVYRDRGLPDLSIANISPRPAAAQGGKSAGWLIAVSVRNDGDAAAEVPVTVRSGTLTATERVRVLAHSNAATRILFQNTPEEVVVGDGTVPEVRESIHIKKVVVATE